MLTWPDFNGPNIIVDDGGDATLLIHEGVKFERVYEKTGELPNPDLHDNKEFKIVVALIRDTITKEDPKKWTKIAA